MNEELKQRLLEMTEEDKRVRDELAATGELFKGYAPRMAEVHNRHARELERIIEQHGWPGKSLAGEEGANAAWLILQHAIGSPDFQRKGLIVLKEAIARGEAEPAKAAFLEDRICFFERRPQRYGTQFDWDENGEMSPWMLEDPERIDEYRCSINLPPIAEQIRRVRESIGEETRSPDLKEREEGMRAWAKSVGWVC